MASAEFHKICGNIGFWHEVEEIKELLKEFVREDHEILVTLREQNRTIIDAVKDHERRIRILERVVMYGIGALGALKLASDFMKH